MTKFVVKGGDRGMSTIHRLGDVERKIKKDFDATLRDLRLSAPPPPENTSPQLPRDITTLSDKDLGRLYGEFASMAIYVGARCAIAGMQAAVDKRSDKVTRSLSLLKQSGTVAEKAALVETDDRVSETSNKLLVSDNVLAVTQAMLEGFLIGRDALSRELTRRGIISHERKVK